MLLLNIDKIITAFIMTLEDKEIIQVDATLSAGVLIFLTLANISGSKFPIQIFLTLLVIIPFSISAFFFIFENVIQSSHLKRRFRNYALILMTGGFIYLVAAVILLFLAGVTRWLTG